MYAAQSDPNPPRNSGVKEKGASRRPERRPAPPHCSTGGISAHAHSNAPESPCRHLSDTICHSTPLRNKTPCFPARNEVTHRDTMQNRKFQITKRTHFAVSLQSPRRPHLLMAPKLITKTHQPPVHAPAFQPSRFRAFPTSRNPSASLDPARLDRSSNASSVRTYLDSFRRAFRRTSL